MNYLPMFPKQKVLSFLLFSLFFPLLAAEINLPHVITYISSSSESVEINLSEEELKFFSSTEEALESIGLSFKDSNNELTFHGFWNSSIKVYINGVLMNDPNTGRFDFSALDISSVRSIKINPVSTDGAVSVYIETLSLDYTGLRYSFGGYSKSYFSGKNFSPNDTWRLHGTVNIPFVFKDGSSFILQENLTGGYDANHFGFISTDASYKPGFSDSYKEWPFVYNGWERMLINNSFSAVFSSSKMPGATFGFSNYLTWNNQNCGRIDGFYYSYQNQNDINTVFAFPVSIPGKNFRIKVIPSYKLSNLEYKKDAAFSNVHDIYQVHSFSIQEESTFCKYINLNSKLNFDFSKNNNLADIFLSPGISMNLAGFDISISAPVNFFFTKSDVYNSSSNRFDFMYSFDLRKNFRIGDSLNTSDEENSKKISDLLTGNLQGFFNASRNITTPVFQQLYYDGGGGSGNPYLKTESAFSFYTGIDWSGVWKTSFKPFLIFYNEKIGWISDALNNWSTQNTGSSINYGFDFSLDTASLFSFVSFRLAYTFCRASLTTNQQTYGKQIMYTPEHSLNASVKIFFMNNFSWTTSYQYISKKYITNENTSYVPEQHYLDSRLDLETGIGKNTLTIYLLWKNIFDFKYTEVSAYPGPGTSLTLGFSFK